MKKKETILLKCGNLTDEMKIGTLFALDLACHCWWNCSCKGWTAKSWSLAERAWGMEP